MAIISVTLTFNHEINRSVQVGDTVYYTQWAFSAGQRQASNGYSGMNKMGLVTAVNRTATGGTIVVDHDDNVPPPATTDFLFFSKDNTANSSSLVGYYAEVKLVNDSTSKVEIFQVNAGISESSK
tara:strand:+ start:184 stop:558 length:375 start_codon:yes stop_codon:yes gene_type:complete